MNRGLTLIGCLGLGAGLMYVLDPDRGRRRRALMRDKAAHAINKTGDATGKTLRDTRNRARGLVAGARSLLKRERASDEVLIERVRSKMGRVVSHPHSIEVTADQGRVMLRGPILESEAEALLECVSSVPGVTGVENNLEVHKQAGDIPGLQGGVARRGGTGASGA
jgi:osmotically-inducible protein OsmY